MSTEYRGDAFIPQRQRLVRRYNPDGGFVATTDFKSFSEASVLALFRAYAGAGVEVEMTSQFGVHEITITDTRGEQRIDRWEFAVDVEQPSVLQNPFLDINQADRDIIAAALQLNVGLEDAVDWLNENTENTYFPVTNEVTERTWRDMKRGATQYETGKLVLVHTTNVSNRYNLNVSDENENCLYTHAQFLNEVLNANLWIFPLPGRLEFKATSFFNRNEPVFRDFCLWSWLKSVSPETTVSNRRVEIQTRYKLDQWSTDRYALAT